MSYVRSWSIALIAVLTMICAFTPAIYAQSDTAAISGFVRDPSNAVVANVSVVVVNEATGVERRATTNSQGYYIVSSLPPGYYTVSAELTGFKRFEKTQNKLDPNIATTVDISLQVGNVTETVNVVADAVAVQSETATVGKLITTNEIRNIPLNGRNPLFLALLKPGVNGGALAQFGFGLSTGGLNINGSRTQDNLITFDGAVAVRTRSNGTSIGVADVDAVQEIQVLTANYNAEYGRSSGGQVRIVTKSGQKDFHGDFYEYFRNSAMNANSWSRNRTAGRPDISGQAEPFRYNQFGYALSGPVYIPGKFNSERNKLFWLWSQEWVRYRQAQLNATGGIRVPSDAMRRGDFSELLTAPNLFYGTPQYIRDPQASSSLACSASDRSGCFQNNVIPTNRLSPQGVALLRSFPLPNAVLPGNNFLQVRGALDNQRKDNVSVDFLPKDNHYFRLRWQNYELTHYDAFRNNTDRAPSILERPNDTASLNYIWTVSPTIINEALFAASADRVKILVQTDGDRYKRSIYGISYPYLFQAKEISDKIPTIEIQNFNTIDGGPYPSASSGPIWQLSDNVTWIRQTHTFKFGGYLERAGQNDFDQINVQGVPGGTNNQNGRFVFNNSRPGGTGLSIANAALGLYDTYAELGNRSYTPYRGHMIEFFAQDSWKATQKLRVEYGVRFSRIQPYYSLWRNMTVFDPASYDFSKAPVVDPATGFVVSGDQYNGLIIPGSGWPDEAKGRIPIADSGQFDRLFKGSKEYSKIHNVWQPRLGFAYQLTDKQVIRAAAGRFVTRLGVSDSVFLGGNPPLQPTVSTSNGLVDNPGGAGQVTGFPLTVTTQDPIFKNPESWVWNTTYQREFFANTTIEVGYVGRRGLHLQRERNLNQLLPGTLRPTTPLVGSVQPNSPNATRPINEDYLRPYKGYATIRSTNNDGTSIYHGLQLGITRRFSQGFTFGAAYTLSKTEDDGSTQRTILPNAYDDSMMWGPSNFDRRHVFVFNTVYELPFLRGSSGLTGKLLGGWQLSGVIQAQTGTPIWVGTTQDDAGVGSGSGNNGENTPPTPWSLVGDPKQSVNQGFSTSSTDQNFWFTPSAFQRPALGTFAAPGSRNRVYNPGFQNWSGALFKTFRITENHRLTFRGEAYNIPNHPNWDGAERNPESANFGKVTTKSFERTFQLSLRYTF
jgi:hypothetical protein